MKVTIVGGGIIGLCSAYYLVREGLKVQIFDKGDFKNNCSYGNAGLIVPSHVNESTEWKNNLFCPPSNSNSFNEPRELPNVFFQILLIPL